MPNNETLASIPANLLGAVTGGYRDADTPSPIPSPNNAQVTPQLCFPMPNPSPGPSPVPPATHTVPRIPLHGYY